MEKKGQIMIALLAIIISIVIGLIVWQAITIINKAKTNQTEQQGSGSNEQSNATLPETNETNGETNDTLPANETGTNETTNETGSSENQTSTIVPNPTGSITYIDRRDDVLGKYPCEVNETPEHGVRLYTYKIINGIKNLSENYTETGEINTICSSFGNLTGINYYIEWKWDSVEGIDGYKVYQHYYRNENVSRTYNYYIDLKTERLIDTDPSLWTRET